MMKPKRREEESVEIKAYFLYAQVIYGLHAHQLYHEKSLSEETFVT